MITATTHASITHDGVPGSIFCDVVLGWTPDDPCAVTIAFPNTKWLLSRDVLSTACTSTQMRSEHGGLDVRIITGPQHLHLMLSSPNGAARVTVHRPPVAAFLDRTFAVVPLGAETFDADALVAGILGGAL